MKSTIDIIRAHVNEEHDPIWSFIWKALIPQHVHLFLWLVGHDRVMSYGNRFHRGLATDPSCRNIPGIHDTSLYILQDYPLALVIWETLVPRHRHSMFFSLPLQPWLGFNLESNYTISKNWPAYFSIVVWML